VEVDGGGVYVVARDNVKDEEYRPLVETPALFLEFARLAEGGEITREVWLEWVERYGVLGLDWRTSNEAMFTGLFGPVRQEGGPKENFRTFVIEARNANRLLRLMEAIESPKGPDLNSFSKELWDIYGLHLPGNIRRMSPKEARVWGTGEAWHEVEKQIRECYPTVIPADGGFVQGWGFHSLISAMYLQMMWLLTAATGPNVGNDVRWCKRPECTKVVDYRQPEQPAALGTKKNDRSRGYKTRKDKKFCSDLCKGLYHYHYVDKPNRRKDRSSR
jgi:hypothetical protein